MVHAQVHTVSDSLFISEQTIRHRGRLETSNGDDSSRERLLGLVDAAAEKKAV
jgi:hypothetical protein|tara:strand:- start:59 stop:217 length:159 start_codon:yes stop_codon:yes gene_type:complete